MTRLEMVCTCDADGFREAEARRIRIYRRMGLLDMGDLTTAIILSLAFDFGADADIGADMWFGVSVVTPVGDVYVECDAIEDGLAAAWEHLAEAHPQRVSVCDRARRELRVAERMSAGMLAWYEGAETAYRAHRAAAHRDNNDCPPCEDCSVLLGLSITAKLTLQESWGAEVVERAAAKAFE